MLLPVCALGTAAWMAARQLQLSRRLGRLGLVASALPLSGTGWLGDGELSTRLAWRALAGASEDRVVVLGEDWYSERAEGRVLHAGRRLLEACRAQGQRIVLISDHPSSAIGPLEHELAADDLICNELELEDGRATGQLIEPIFTGRLDGGWVRTYAARHGLEASACSAYGARATDATLLSGVGRPCTVTPDRALRRLATTFDWPVVEAG